MSKSPKHLICTFLAMAIALTLLFACHQVMADQITGDDLTPETKAPEYPEIKKAFESLVARDITGAKKILDEAVVAHPELPPSEVIMAQFFGQLRQANGMRAWLQQAVTEHPKDPEAYAILGAMDAQSGLTVEAWLLLEKAKSLMTAEIHEKRQKPLKTAITTQLAQLAMHRKNWEEAKGYLNQLLNEDPANYKSLQLLAKVFFEEDKVDQALDKLLAAQAAAKAAGESLLTPQATLALWYEDKDDRRNAIKYMTEAIKANDKDFNTRLAAAEWAFKIKNFDEAQRQAAAALDLDKDSITAMLMAGNIEIFRKDYKAAEKYLRQAWEKSPSTFAISNNLAIALCEQDDKDKLTTALNLGKMNAQMHQNDKNATEALSTLGRLLYKSDRLKEAEQMLRKAASLRRSISPDTAYYMAVIFAETDRKDEAKKLLQTALKSKGLFAQRSEAEKLLQQLNK
ncbi:MAG: hypothetical protein PVH19_02075 [Planctomycetia bacterium]|jgi:tetratricopeptide (TPR) repeat protein